MFTPDIKENFAVTVNGNGCESHQDAAVVRGRFVTALVSLKRDGASSSLLFNPPNLSGNCLDLVLDLVKKWRSLVEQVRQSPWRFVCGKFFTIDAGSDIFRLYGYFQALWKFCL